ncbi:CBS domain containing-hemolysin-like protein [Kineococcus radiotolerans]|uniref:CBS domain containing protein n=2 Tax=Kineococcus radiotolerans TaxID=131568 RepID=A6WDG0_KINRD|nr:hemolysin family protein [Kineococcus radiotolerans]ABS04849.1 CBS domain containing protein [Kineococcus radiotolerans SRS30216 = ATCC BAA-149]MBB2901692.1 CBS domain containing-hemolysin-like protein [Kineococcus radiotolerans]
MGAPAVPLLLLALVLVVAAGLVAAAESAIAGTSRRRARELEADGRRGAAELDRVLGSATSVLTVATLLRVVFETLAAVCVAVVVASWVDSWWLVLLLAGLGMSALDFVLVGVGPRTLGRLHAETVARRAAPVLGPLTTVLGPLARALVAVGNAVTPGRGMRQGPFGSEAELREIVELAGETSVIEAGERRMINSVFELGDTLVREVMVPRTDVVSARRGAGLHEVEALLLRSGFSRMPVIGEDADEVLGIVYLKDVARRFHTDPVAARAERVETVARQTVFVPDSLPVDELLRQMQRDTTHVAIVVDEYGGTAGLVTIEDVIEEIVGDIADEYDRAAPDVEPLPDGGFRVSSRLHVEDLGELFEKEIEDEDVDTVGGLLAKTLGEVLVPGAVAEVHGLRLEADARVGRRNQVRTVLVHRLPEHEPELVDDHAGGHQHD